jgi:uncharacterized surface protein with fasciclin (FAS1) repeats
MHRCIAVFIGLVTSLVPFSGAIGLPFEVGAALKSSPTLATFYSMVASSGLLDSSNASDTPVTVFAPINSALALVPNNFVSSLLNDTGFRPHLVTLILHHTVVGSVQPKDLASSNSTTLDTLSEEPLVLQNQQGLVNLISGMTSAFITDTIVLGGGASKNTSLSLSNETSTTLPSIVHVVSNALLPKFYYQTLLEASDSSFFQQLAGRLGLADSLQTESLTLFAPTSDAFVSLPSYVFNDTDLLRRLLRRHVVRGVYSSFSMFGGNGTTNQTVLRTLSGEEIVVDRMRDGSWEANGVPVVRRDLLAQNGVVHQVQGILGIKPTQPPTAEPTQMPRTVWDEIIEDDDLSTFKTALTLVAGMNATLNDVLQENVTVLAPVRTAFQNLDADLVRTIFQPEWIAHLRELVHLHTTDRGGLTSQLLKEKGGGNMTMLSGDRLSVSIGSQGTIFIAGPDGVAATAVSPATEALNGVLLKTDTVLLPNFLQRTVMDVLENSIFVDIQNVSTFVSMVRQVNFESALRSGVYSVLAPSNEALAGLGTERLSDLLKEENVDELRSLVLYHVIPGVLPFSHLENETLSFTSENGKMIESVSCESCGSVGHRFNNISVSRVDLLARNGLVHILSGVLDVAYNATGAPTVIPTASPSISPSRLSNTTLQPTLSNATNRSPTPAATPNQPTVTSGAEARFLTSWPVRFLHLPILLLPGLL